MAILWIKVGAIGFTCLGGFITYQCVRIQNSGMPSATVLSNIDNQNEKYLKNKYRYFVDAGDDKNKKGWKGSFNYRWFEDRGHQKDMSPPFQSITGIKGLKETCKKMYEKKTEDVGEKEREDMFRYCSPLGQKPQMINPDNSVYDENSWALKKPTELVSTHNEANKHFGHMQDAIFFDSLGKYNAKDKSDESKKTLFDKFYDTKGRRTQTLREVCNGIYSSSSNDTAENKVTEDDLVKYCGYADTPA